MSDAFGDSVSRGRERGLELAEMDRVMVEAQGEFLALCREFMASYLGIVDVEYAQFDLMSVSPAVRAGQVTVMADGAASVYSEGGSRDLGGSVMDFSRPLFGHYENRCKAASELRDEVDRMLDGARRSMSSVLEQVAREVSRREANAGS